MRNSLSILGLVAALLSAGCQEAFSYNPGTMPNRPQEPSEGVQQNAKEYLVSSTAELSALKNLKAGDVVVWENGVYENVSIKFSGQGLQEQESQRAQYPQGGDIVRSGEGLPRRGGFFRNFHLSASSSPAYPFCSRMRSDFQGLPFPCQPRASQ